MRLLRFRAVFPREMKSNVVQRDLSSFNRIGMVQSVDALKGTCVVKWFDHPGIRTDVIITQASAKEWHMPEVGSVVLVEFDQYERARIVRYMNLGQAVRINAEKSLPKLKEGERLWETGGSYIYMRKNGDIIIATLNQGFFIVESRTNTLKSSFVNWKCITNGGTQFFGIVKRFTSDTEGNKQSTAIQDINGNTYTEYNLKMVEFSDDALEFKDITSPLVDLTIGTLVDDNGVVVAKNDQLSPTPQKQVTIDLKLLNGIRISIDKDGRITITGANINLNNGSVDSTDPDVALGLETNNTNLGKREQHAAREHDIVTIPISNEFSDPDHMTLQNTINPENLLTLQWLAKSFVNGGGPCTFNPATLPNNTKLLGVITAGAKNLYVGDT